MKSFVHSSLDDAGLDPFEFRVYARVLRRGECTESVPSTARELHMGETVARRSRLVLVRAGFLSAEPRDGATPVLRALGPESWGDLAAARAAVAAESARYRQPVKPLSDQTGVGVSNQTGGPVHTPDGSDMGVRFTPVFSDTPPLSDQTGPPLSDQTPEGSPSEGAPIKVTSEESSDAVAVTHSGPAGGPASGGDGGDGAGEVSREEPEGVVHDPFDSAARWRPSEGWLARVRVPLNESEEELRDRMRRVAEAVRSHQAVDHPKVLYMLTFGQGTNGEAGRMPAAGQYADLSKHFKRWPLGWLVAAYVVAAARGARSPHQVPKFIEPWEASVRGRRPAPTDEDPALAAPRRPGGAAPAAPASDRARRDREARRLQDEAAGIYVEGAAQNYALDHLLVFAEAFERLPDGRYRLLTPVTEPEATSAGGRPGNVLALLTGPLGAAVARSRR